MVVTGWCDGKHLESGAGYGLKVEQRDLASFNRVWGQVTLELEGYDHPVSVNIAKDSFWGKCRELIGRDIGRWLLQNKLAPWSSGHPPKLQMMPVGEGRFQVSRHNMR